MFPRKRQRKITEVMRPGPIKPWEFSRQTLHRSRVDLTEEGVEEDPEEEADDPDDPDADFEEEVEEELPLTELIGSELKYFDTGFSTGLGTAFTMMPGSLCLIPRGAGENQRVGNSIVIRHISSRVAIRYYNLARLVLIWDKQANGADPLAASIWTSMAPFGGATFDFRNLANAERFVVLADVSLFSGGNLMGGTMNANPSEGGQLYRQIELDVNIPVNYTGSAGVITEIIGNNLMWFGTDNGEGSAGHHGTRIRFTDVK